MDKLKLGRVMLAFAIFYFLLIGLVEAVVHSNDFIPLQTGASCMLHGCDPYNEAQLLKEYARNGGDNPDFRQAIWPTGVPPVYPPGSFLVVLPLALVRYPLAKLLWFVLNAALFLVAARMMLKQCREKDRWLAVFLVAFFVGHMTYLVKMAQPAGFAISAATIAYLLFLERRRLALATVMLCLSVAIKPQMAGLLALYLLWRQGTRRHVAVALGGALAIQLAGAAILHQNAASANWLPELRQSIAESLLPGHTNDPAAETSDQISLQSAAAVFTPGATASGLVADGISLVLAGFWVAAVVRFRRDDQDGFLFMTGGLLVFSLLLVYHRLSDSTLLLMAIPSIQIAVERMRKAGLALAGLTIFASTPIQNQSCFWLPENHPAIYRVIVENRFLYLLVQREANLAMLGLFGLYLWIAFSPRFHEGKELAAVG